MLPLRSVISAESIQLLTTVSKRVMIRLSERLQSKNESLVTSAYSADRTDGLCQKGEKANDILY